ncbi:hypothetical protein CAPTEDRAFT_186134, partial [Capitella teleta]
MVTVLQMAEEKVEQMVEEEVEEKVEQMVEEEVEEKVEQMAVVNTVELVVVEEVTTEVLAVEQEVTEVEEKTFEEVMDEEEVELAFLDDIVTAATPIEKALDLFAQPDEGMSEIIGGKCKKKPQRPCPFCGTSIGGGKLKRHITRKHRDRTEVKEALGLSSKEQAKHFAQWRSEAIYNHNIKEISTTAGPSNLLRERRGRSKDIRMCSGCKRFLSSKGYHKHRRTCGPSADALKPWMLCGAPADEDFTRQILSKFRDGECGRICRSDPLVLK